ncbi:transposase and inactivated derivatives (plasmid) [Methylobacterium aquaticum]|uniref:Transposase and inactivated derivatives n=1 Tax=Methylobacterium aquaticum TaxID=270351 RepID=A0A1Y0ZJ10_9HYPH|nr:transposase and inactivated derivatives [Methylobacterium aquaticum]
MPASRATVLRLVTRMPMPDTPAPIRVGIDDWAIRKGSRYGTIVVDLDRHRVIDLLPDRTAPTVAGWLERHSGVELVGRDRSTEYARGASLGTPQAQPVADRWHLLTNMRQAVERWLQGAHARLRNLPLLPGSAVRPARRDRAFARSTPELEAGAQSWMRWQAVYDEVRRRHAGGEPLLGIARALGLARATVRKYASAEMFPARLPHGAGQSLLDPHIAYLAERIDEGCENAMALWREIRKQGYPGTTPSSTSPSRPESADPRCGAGSSTTPKASRASCVTRPTHLASRPIPTIPSLRCWPSPVPNRLERSPTGPAALWHRPSGSPCARSSASGTRTDSSRIGCAPSNARTILPSRRRSRTSSVDRPTNRFCHSDRRSQSKHA